MKKASWQKKRAESPSLPQLQAKTSWSVGPGRGAHGCFNTKMHTSIGRFKRLRHMTHGVVCRTTWNRACVEKPMLSSGCALCHKSSLCLPLPLEPLKAFVRVLPPLDVYSSLSPLTWLLLSAYRV